MVNNELAILSAAIARLTSELTIPNGYTIRTATPTDKEQICVIARSATERFGEIPALADLVESEDLSPSSVEDWLDRGAICIVDDSGGVAVGFAAAHTMDDALYIAEISVLREHQGKGVGGLLIQAIFEWARERQRQSCGEARVSLTTYADAVPWNGPWYRRRGFREVDAASLGPRHAHKMLYDVAERGLVRPGYRRCAMSWQPESPSSPS